MALGALTRARPRILSRTSCNDLTGMMISKGNYPNVNGTFKDILLGYMIYDI